MHPYLRAFTYNLPRVVAKKIVGKSYTKDSSSVFAHYEPMRDNLLQGFRRNPPSFEDYISTLGVVDSGLLLNGRRTHDLKALRRCFLDELHNQINQFGAKKIVELGSGGGRHSLALKRENPSLEVLGLELSNSGVAISRAAAEHYEIDCEFRQFDATGSWSSVPKADLIFSVHVLEQMPIASSYVIDRMAEHADTVVMIEPFPDFWTGLTGLARKVRAADSYRLRSGSFSSHTPVEARLLDYGEMINRPSLVVLRS